MKCRRLQLLPVALPLVLAATSLSPAMSTSLASGTFVDNASEPFGTFGGVDFVRHTGRFVGTTSLGDFRMPYEIVAPAADAMIAGGGIAAPGVIDLTGVVDEEIIVQFVEALTTDPFAVGILGPVDLHYAYGISQTAEALLETLHSAGGPGLLDLTLLHITLWRPPFQPPGVFDFTGGEFMPLAGVGRVVFVESEGDQVVTDAEQFRRAADRPDYRVYELAGAAHQVSASNPLDHWMVMRAIFVAADRWVRRGVPPPPSTLLEEAPAGQIDPVYGFETGIARDADLNARGGVRLPDVAVGRAQFIAADFTAGIFRGSSATWSTWPASPHPAPGSTGRASATTATT